MPILIAFVQLCNRDHIFILFKRTLGVAGIDVTLAEIEDLLQRYEWGTAYSFLINTDGEAIFHPRLKPSSEVKIILSF